MLGSDGGVPRLGRQCAQRAACVQETWAYQGINGSVVLVAQSCLILCDPMDCSQSAFPASSPINSLIDLGLMHTDCLLWRREWQPTPVFFPEEFHGQRSLVGYSLWGYKESDATE